MQLRAYLVSGAFRVHRADCRDCEKEARRSDSPGGAEEYASRAEAIADLWSDIISDDPAFYATPGASPAWKPRPSSCPAPADCSDTSPGTGSAGVGSQPGDAEELAAWAAGLGLESADLDDLVHDAFSRQAPETNNGGLESQVRFPAESYGAGRAWSLLGDLRPETAGPASAGGTAVPPAGEQRAHTRRSACPFRDRLCV